MSRILAIDIGTVRIGVAVSDARGVVASPVETVEARPRHAAITRILAIAEDYGATEFVYGMPFELDGTEGRAAKRTRLFVSKLVEKAPDITIVEWDERMSSVVAERALLEGDLSRAKRKKVVDQAAATLILQCWLDARTATRDRAASPQEPFE